jgi:hypothetical protein
MDAGEFVLTLITGVLTGGGIGGIILALIARRKAKSEIAVNESDAEKKEAETSEIITRAAGQAIQFMENRICTLQREVDALKTQVDELQDLFDSVVAGAKILHAQIVDELHATPKWNPPERRKR